MPFRYKLFNWNTIYLLLCVSTFALIVSAVMYFPARQLQDRMQPLPVLDCRYKPEECSNPGLPNYEIVLSWWPRTLSAPNRCSFYIYGKVICTYTIDQCANNSRHYLCADTINAVIPTPFNQDIGNDTTIGYSHDDKIIQIGDVAALHLPMFIVFSISTIVLAILLIGLKLWFCIINKRNAELLSNQYQPIDL